MRLTKPRPVRLMCSILVLLASTLPVVAPVTLEDLDLFPPPANGPPEPRRFGLAGFLNETLELILRYGGVGQRAGAQ